MQRRGVRSFPDFDWRLLTSQSVRPFVPRVHRESCINEITHDDRGFPPQAVRFHRYVLGLAGLALVHVDVRVMPAGESVPYHHNVLHDALH